MKSIAIVAHKYLPQPDDDLVLYLKKQKTYKIFHIKHRFPDASDRRSILDIYGISPKSKKIKTADYTGFPELALRLKEMLFTFKWLIGLHQKFDIYIGMDGLCAFWGILLKKMGVCSKVIYWNIDFVPVNRFGSYLKNFVYHRVNNFACKNADEVWDLSPRMLAGRQKYFGIGKKDYKTHKTVPYGLWTGRIKRVSYSNCDKNTLVFMGHLLPKQGVDMVLKEIPNIIKKIPQFKFRIIGDGSYKTALINMSKSLNVNKYCEFTGRIESSEVVERKIAKSAVAIAPYRKMKDNYSYYADPGKVKTYLACGVPVLLTDIPWNANEISERKCGMIIKDDGSDLVEKLMKIMKPEANRQYRGNSIKYSEKFNYEKIFGSLKL